jgi:predicted permease
MLRLLRVLRVVYRRRRFEEAMSDELASHLEHYVEDLMRQGRSRDEALREARLAFGHVDSVRDECRASRRVRVLDDAVQDVRYALRTLRRDAGWTTAALAIAALGVASSATVFSVVNALLLRALPFTEANRLVWIANGTSENLSAQTVQVANLIDLREQSRAFAAVAAFSPFYGVGDIRLTGAGEAERLTAVPVTEDFFRVLGVRPQAGRFFTADECRWQAPATVILDDGFWRRRFAADPGVIGRAITLDGKPATIVGIAPPSFNFVALFNPGSRADLFVPYPLAPETNRRGNTLALVGRLAAGVDLRAAQADASLVGDRVDALRAAKVRRNGFRPVVSPLRERVSGRFADALFVLAAFVSTLMLLVCANLSNLLLARAAARQREMALRVALGASRSRLVRQLLVESLTLSSGGAALGLALTFAATSVLASLDGVKLPLEGVRVDGAALAFTALIAMVTGVAFGVLPALQASKVSPQDALKEGGRGLAGGARDWVRRGIVVGEIVLVCVLLTGAGLLTRSLARVLDANPGFDPHDLITLRVDPARAYVDPSRANATREARSAYYDQVREQIRSIDGVGAVGLTDALPLGENFGWRTWDASTPVPGQEPRRVSGPLVRMIDEGYLAAMRIPVQAGRGFTAADREGSEPVIIVNEALARALFPDADPIGRILRTSGVDRRVVGVVGGVSYFALDRDSGGEMYMPMRQTGDGGVIDLVVRSARPASDMAAAVRASLKRVDADLPVAELRTMQQLVDRSVFTRRFVVWLVASFAAFGIVLAMLGIYAVIAYSVVQRTQEIGIRMALGASPRDVTRRFLTQTMTLALAGLAIGLPAAWLAARGLRSLLFGVTPSDVTTFAAVGTLVVVVAAMAGYVPARRAARVDPLTSLRAD